MPDAVEDFWPDELGVMTEITPVVVLREQAAILGRKTQNLIEAVVETSISEDAFVHSLSLRVPTLGDYRYHLLTISHRPEVYPVRIWRPGSSDVHARDLESFKAKLREFLSSEEVKRTVNTLLTYARS